MKLYIYTLCALLTFTLSAGAGLIISVNVDEASGRDPMAAGDLAGALPGIRVGNWNNFRAGNRSLPTNIESPNAGNFVYNDGTVVGGSFAVNVTGGGGFVAATGNINDAMLYTGYMNNNSDGKQSVFTLTDVPFAEYDLYVYAQGQAPNVRGGTVQISGSGTTYYAIGGNSPASDGTGYVAMTTTSLPVDKSTIAFGNYAVYTGLTGSSQTIITTSYLWGDHARQQTYGFQIVDASAVPEAGTLGLVGISGLALVLIFRRRRR